VVQGFLHGDPPESISGTVFACDPASCKGTCLPKARWALAGPRQNGVIAGTILLFKRAVTMPAGERLATSPFDQFHAWMSEAEKSEPNDPNAMVVATATPDGRPSLRTILLKGVDERGFVFYTNKESRKGVELAINANVALLFHWKSLRRQIRIEGTVEHVTDSEADTYFASRPRISRLGAWASQQSRRLENRAVLEARLAETEQRFPDDIPRPAYWSGYRVLPEMLEFWQDMPYRLHDRTTYHRSGTGTWEQTKLFP
jgi:pyridoxamine 5'-phosphate oxidase